MSTKRSRAVQFLTVIVRFVVLFRLRLSEICFHVTVVFRHDAIGLYVDFVI